MKTQRFHHVIDFLFAAALFGVFLVSSVMVIAVGAGAYRNITEKSQEDYTLRTSLSYVNEKLRQADSNGALSVGMVGGNTALMLTQDYDGESYTTYIYESNGSLCELFTKSDAPADPDYGTPLLTLSDFGIERLADALYRVSITTEDGMTSSLLLHPFSTNAAFDNTETDSRSAGSESSGVSESEVEP